MKMPPLTLRMPQLTLRMSSLVSSNSRNLFFSFFFQLLVMFEQDRHKIGCNKTGLQAITPAVIYYPE
jgi:hypothetical protein